jgi:7-keto-8-aminopelargonate synthetase-like enzyme
MEFQSDVIATSGVYSGLVDVVPLEFIAKTQKR